MSSGAGNVSAVVCTYNSISSIQACLQSLQDQPVREIIVVDAGSTDGTREVAATYATRLLSDARNGLGAARNIGIAVSTGSFVLNAGSDNVFPAGSIAAMVHHLESGGFQGVSALTQVRGSRYLQRAMGRYREARFRPGEAAIIGTPTLFPGQLLRQNPFDPGRRFSDDSELCERWTRQSHAAFAIVPVVVYEDGKSTWDEVKERCRTYGVSDLETFSIGAASGWR